MILNLSEARAARSAEARRQAEDADLAAALVIARTAIADAVAKMPPAARDVGAWMLMGEAVDHLAEAEGATRAEVLDRVAERVSLGAPEPTPTGPAGAPPSLIMTNTSTVIEADTVEEGRAMAARLGLPGDTLVRVRSAA